MASVTVNMMGGAGNQMFQYAAARALALRTGADLVLDILSYRARSRHTPPRSFCLDRFPIAARIAPKRQGDPGRLGKLADRAVRWFATGRVPRLREAHFHFDPRIISARPPVRLDGYFQSERYFADAEEQIRAELAPPAEAGYAAALAHRIGEAQSVSLHVRRTDYTQGDAASVHGLCAPDYYAAAVAELSQRLGPLEIFVFSDDIAWAEANLDLKQPATFVSDGRVSDLGELWLMSLCRHHVIANSTFSWWGAWLSPNPDKIVIAPRKWFADGSFDTTDLVPESWFRR